MDEVRRFSLVKPTLNTPFQIDFDWWKQHDNNWRIFLYSLLCSQHQVIFADFDNDDTLIDWVDAETAEVRQVDGLQQALMDHCSRQPGFLSEHTTLVDAVFRVLVANGNKPMTPIELSAKLGRPADMILRTLSGPQVYRGIRPRPA
jgi:hypothetical protein